MFNEDVEVGFNQPGLLGHVSTGTGGSCKYRKKPVIIEAIQLLLPNTPDMVLSFCPMAKMCGVGAVGEKIWMEIPTLEGTMRADYGDYIIKGIKGEFYPCKPDIFEASYERV